jgi:hypothetical protein
METMNSKIQMIIQYEINESFVQQYKDAMKKVMKNLPSFEANHIQLSSANNLVTETFLLPTESHYFALKKLRTSKNHSLFGCLDPFIKGGVKQMGCYAFKRY